MLHHIASNEWRGVGLSFQIRAKTRDGQNRIVLPDRTCRIFFRIESNTEHLKVQGFSFAGVVGENGYLASGAVDSMSFRSPSRLPSCCLTVFYLFFSFPFIVGRQNDFIVYCSLSSTASRSLKCLETSLGLGYPFVAYCSSAAM